MYPLYKKDGSIVNFVTEEGAKKTLKSFSKKYSLTNSIKSKNPVEPVEELI